MHKLSARALYSGSGVRVIVVESIDLDAYQGVVGHQCVARLAPVALVVCGDRGDYAIDLTNELADIDHLQRVVPGLSALMAGSHGASP